MARKNDEENEEEEVEKKREGNVFYVFLQQLKGQLFGWRCFFLGVCHLVLFCIQPQRDYGEHPPPDEKRKESSNPVFPPPLAPVAAVRRSRVRERFVAS